MDTIYLSMLKQVAPISCITVGRKEQKWRVFLVVFQFLYSVLIIACSHQHMFSTKANVGDGLLFVWCVPLFENQDSYVRKSGNSPRNVLKQLFLKNSGKYYAVRRDALPVLSVNANTGKCKVMHLHKKKERKEKTAQSMC